MTGPSRVLAVDLGASSIRVAEVDLAAPEPAVSVVHRWPHAPVADSDGLLRWDWRRIVAEVNEGLKRAIDAGPVASIGVDGWGVDYALIDNAGRTIAAPFSYRDSRTDDWRETANMIGFERLYEITGIQLMGINTIFQLAAHDPAEFERASRLLLLPDLLVHTLTGFEGAERSNASTTGLLDARTGDWSSELIDAIDVDRSLFPNVVGAGTEAGSWHDIPVHLVGSHDTASAFLGMPGGNQAGTAFVSTGSWVIVGVERPFVDTSLEARGANFSNEAGAFGGFRFLKNVVGLWMVEQCRPAWGNPPLDLLFGEAEAVEDSVPLFDARHERFVNSTDMDGEIRDAAGLQGDASRGVVMRTVLESIAASVAEIVEELRVVTDAPISRIAFVGGGARSQLLNRLVATHTGLPISVGSSEATALGNAVAQGVALGYFNDLTEARRWVDPTAMGV